MRDRYDVIVVGTRVGGSTLTALLGDAGVSVLLLDRVRVGRTRVRHGGYPRISLPNLTRF